MPRQTSVLTMAYLFASKNYLLFVRPTIPVISCFVRYRSYTVAKRIGSIVMTFLNNRLTSFFLPYYENEYQKPQSKYKHCF